MIVYNERKIGKSSEFSSIAFDEKGRISSKRAVHIPMYQTDIDGFHYFMLYDDFTVPIHEAYDYLNHVMHYSPLTTRRSSAFALRLLYIFLSLSNRTVYELDDKAVRELVLFLCGIGASSGKYGLITQRSHETVNIYLSVYRTFMEAENIPCDALMRKNVSSYLKDEEIGTFKASYRSSLKTSAHKNDTVPKHITPDEFRKIYKVITDAGDEQARIIVHLMYVYGLRLGEVLGLTYEDIREIKIDGQLTPVVTLRNRMSDANFQYCKGLPHVTDKKEYKSRDYRQSSENVAIMYCFYEELVGFINAEDAMLAERYPENYAKSTADTVSEKDYMSDEPNHYVFLNRYGRALSDSTWNIRLREYFRKAGIPIDKDTRENNLNHKFRHGFAMWNSHYSKHPVDSLTLQKMMRHKSLASTMIYYTLTAHDEFEIKSEYQHELYDMIPELGRGLEFDWK